MPKTTRPLSVDIYVRQGRDVNAHAVDYRLNKLYVEHLSILELTSSFVLQA